MIEAKHLKPRLDRVTLRPDAVDALAAAFGHRLSVLCAPAGYGKTTTTAATLEASGHRSAWYKLDILDRDPLAFLAGMIRAVQRLHPGFGENLLLELESGPLLELPPQALAARFCSECDRVVTTPGHVVLDDYHEAMDAPAMNEVLGYLLDNCPETMRFVVLTRYEPAFRLEKLRLAGEVARVPRDLLLFDTEQVAEVLHHRSGRRHEIEHVRRLLDLTEGWPASVVLAGMALAWLDLASLEVALADPRLRGDIFSYLAEQVFQRQSGDVQRFLLRTCCLDHVNGELAERLLGESSASRHLHFLARNHVFTFEAGREGTYRYHNLLRDFLRQRFVQEEGETAFKDLQRKTAAALEACGDRSGAVELLLGANEVELALAAIARGGEGLLERLPSEQLRHWAAQLAIIANGERPWALVVSAVLDTRNSHFSRALNDLNSAVEYLERRRDRGLYQALSILEWAQFWSGDTASSMMTCRRALRHARSNAERLHTLLSLLSAAIDMRQWDTVESASEEADQLLPHASADERERAQALRAHAAFYRGDMNHAAALISGCHQRAGSLAQRATYLNTQGMIAVALADYGSAEAHLAEAARIADGFGHALASHIEDNLAFLDGCLGRFDASLDRLRALGRFEGPVDPTHLCIVLMHEGTSLRRSGNPEAALEPAQHAAESIDAGRDAYLARNAQVNLAMCHGLLGSEQRPLLDAFRSGAKGAGLPFVELKAVLFSGILAHVAGEPPQAVRHLEACLPQQLALGHINLIAQELCPRPELTSLILRRHKSNGLGTTLIAALSRHWRFSEVSSILRESCPSQVGTWIDLVEAQRLPLTSHTSERRTPHEAAATDSLEVLTPRERQVLALMADDRSNPEIAAELFISLSTVKTHVNHILRKLGQTKRVGAVLEYQRVSGRLREDPGRSLGTHLNPPA